MTATTPPSPGVSESSSESLEVPWKPKALRVIESVHRRHWIRRWNNAAIDSFMGGKVIQPANRAAAELVVRKLGKKRILDVGAGCYQFLYLCRKRGATRLAATELDIPRARALLPYYVDGHFSTVPYPFPWADGEFEVAYQNNAIANMRSSHIPHVIAEMARVAELIVFGLGLGVRPCFWEGPGKTGQQRSKWVLDLVNQHADLILQHPFMHYSKPSLIRVWKVRR